MAALAFLMATVTQGGADAFAQAEVQTGLSGQTQQAYRVRHIEFEIPIAVWGVASQMELCLTRRSKAAMPLITDVDVIKKFKLGSGFTTSGAQSQQNIWTWDFSEDEDLLIVEDPIYFQVDSNATGLTQTVYSRIGYELVKISQLDRLTLLTQSLS